MMLFAQRDSEMFLYCQIYRRRTNIVCPVVLSQYIEGHESTFDYIIDRDLCPLCH